MSFTIRKAERTDMPTVMSLIRELAEYEKMTDQVSATAETLEASIFDRNEACALVLEEDGEAIGYAIYCFNFSTFKGRAGLYLEDIYIRPQNRGNGYGTQVFEYLKNTAKELGCPRMDWVCLDWNEPSLKFYKGMGAKALCEWVIHRIEF